MRIALLKFAFVRLESFRTARSIKTSDRSAFCAAGQKLTHQGQPNRMAVTHTKYVVAQHVQLGQTSKLARATTVLMK